MKTLLLLTALLCQDAKDLPKWVEQLADESIQVREEASTRIEALGSAAIAELTRLKEKIEDLEQRSRVESLISRIEKRAELLKVFGPTRRITFSAKGLPLEKVLADVGAALGEKLSSENLDLKKKVDLDLKNATLWEALDRIAEAADGHYKYGGTVVFIPGRVKGLPALYYEQFRIGVGEIKTIDHREPGGAETSGVVIVTAHYQRDLSPARNRFDKSIKITSVQNAKGDAKGSAPEWIGSTMIGGGGGYELAEEYVDVTSGDVLKIEGTVEMAFATGRRDVTLDLTGEGKSVKIGEVTLSIDAFSQSAAGARLTLGANGKSEVELGSAFSGTLELLDAAGKKITGVYRGGGGSTDSQSWNFEFSEEVPTAKKATFQWSTEFHKVEIPFRLEGIKVP